jgi:murein DD-endopeptidase MepM/ murein hydrolase activator NlpD
MNTLVAPLLTLLLMTSGLSGPTPVPASPSTGAWPLDPAPRVVSRFDPPLSRYAPGHRGVDLAGTSGQRVRSAAAGRVTFAGSLAGRGVVVVSHGTTRTTYEPVRPKVEVGAVVSAGEVLGTLQSFASHCAPAACLHWGLLEGETYLDPLTLVGGGPVRLLPLYGPTGPVDVSPGPVSTRPGGTSTWSPVLRRAGAPAGRPGAAGRW